MTRVQVQADGTVRILDRVRAVIRDEARRGGSEGSRGTCEDRRMAVLRRRRVVLVTVPRLLEVGGVVVVVLVVMVVVDDVVHAGLVVVAVAGIVRAMRRNTVNVMRGDQPTDVRQRRDDPSRRTEDSRQAQEGEHAP